MRFYLLLALTLALLLQLDAVRVAHDPAAPHHPSTTPAFRRSPVNRAVHNGPPPAACNSQSSTAAPAG